MENDAMYMLHRSSSLFIFILFQVFAGAFGTLGRRRRARSYDRGDEDLLSKADGGEKRRPDSGYAEGSSADSSHGRRGSTDQTTTTPLRRHSEATAATSPCITSGMQPNFSSLSLSAEDKGEEEEEESEREKQERYHARAMCTLNELLTTEKTYVEGSLKEVVDGYYAYIEETKTDPEGKVKIPQDLLGGKDRIIFGNIRDIYDFHQRCISLHKRLIKRKLSYSALKFCGF